MVIYIDYWVEAIKDKNNKPKDHTLAPDNYYQQLGSILKQGIDSGSFRSMNTELTAKIVFSAVGGLVFQWITGGKDFPLINAAEELAKTILNRIKKK